MGFSIDAIAANRELKPSTIFSHLFKLKEEWHTIDLRKLIADNVFDAISEGIRTKWFTQESKLREIYEYFEEKYSYDEIRMVMLLIL
jgi:ATP-dependent DNA helicase RecQ